MKKELFITSKDNTLNTFLHFMCEGKRLMDLDKSIKDFEVVINWKQNCCKLYLIK